MPTRNLEHVGCANYRMPPGTITPVDVALTNAMTDPIPADEFPIEVKSDGTTGVRYTVDGSAPAADHGFTLGDEPGNRRVHRNRDLIRVWCPTEAVITVRPVQASAVGTLISGSVVDEEDKDTATTIKMRNRLGSRVRTRFDGGPLDVDTGAEGGGVMRVSGDGVTSLDSDAEDRQPLNLRGVTVKLQAGDAGGSEGMWRATPDAPGPGQLLAGDIAVTYGINGVSITGPGGEVLRAIQASNINAMQTQLDNLDTYAHNQVEALNDRFTTVNDRIDTVRDNINDHIDTVQGNLNDRIDTQVDRIDNTNGNVNTLQSEMNTVQGDINTLQTQVNNLQSQAHTHGGGG